MSRTAETFILQGIQDWGQSDAERVAAVQAVLNDAGFKATATCGPVFGGIWPTACTGPDAEKATAWLKLLTSTMARGKFEIEMQHVANAIAAAQSQHTGAA